MLGIRKVEQAQTVLRELGFPKAQQNERSALVLLALLGLRPRTAWKAASNPMMGITEMMSYMAKHYGKTYAPNSRESVRRRTIHQFRDAGLVAQNPDAPERSINSGDTVYQIVPEALAMLVTFGTNRWVASKRVYLRNAPTLREVYAQPRRLRRIPVKLRRGKTVSLSPGKHNLLVKKVIEDFVPRFAPGAALLYVGDTERKWAHVDEDALGELGLSFDSHGKFPDVVVHWTKKGWLLLVEAVTSHGPIDPKRHRELEALFARSSSGLVHVTAFLTRKDLAKYLGTIAWETEVWVADWPDHMIHFDGQRFLGPYSE